MKSKHKITMFLAGCIVFISIFFVLYKLHDRKSKEGVTFSAVLTVGIQSAIEKYYRDHHERPPLDTIATSLAGTEDGSGEYIKNGGFVQGNKFIDEWDTPILIEYGQDGRVSIRAAGRNKKYGDKDDIVVLFSVAALK